MLISSIRKAAQYTIFTTHYFWPWRRFDMKLRTKGRDRPTKYCDRTEGFPSTNIKAAKYSSKLMRRSLRRVSIRSRNSSGTGSGSSRAIFADNSWTWSWVRIGVKGSIEVIPRLQQLPWFLWCQIQIIVLAYNEPLHHWGHQFPGRPHQTTISCHHILIAATFSGKWTSTIKKRSKEILTFFGVLLLASLAETRVKSYM